MNILTLADVECGYLWNEHNPVQLKNIDLILSAGDLDPDYLSFLATFNHAPILYVHGNHDEKYMHHPPGGCICIEDQIYCHNGVRILGLGGSMRYKDGEHMYTEGEMRRRIRKRRLSLLYYGGFDILLTHSPAYELSDAEDLPHRGFRCFRTLLDRYQPAYMVHGHTHLNYSAHAQRRVQYGKTEIVNAYERCLITL